MKKTLITSLAAMSGLAASLSAQTVVSSDVTTSTTWGNALNPSPIILEKPVFVKNGATLTILPGTIVRGQPRTAAVQEGVIAGTPGALIVTQNGRLVANGTSSSPIIFTTAAVDNNNDGVADDDNNDGFKDAWVSGDTFYDDTPTTAPLAPLDANGDANVALWGGMVVCGNAPTNLANLDGVGYGKGLVEGLTVPGFPAADATYGGLLPHDNSGSMTFLSVRHAGDEIGDSNELNGITLAGVGDATVFENIEVYCNFDDGIEWFGGTVDGKNLACFFIGDDSFDVDQGYTGSNQFLFAIKPFFKEDDDGKFGSKSGDKAGEFDGLDSTFNTRNSNNLVTFDATPWPLHASNFYNMTVIGKTQVANPEFTATVSAGDTEGFDLKEGFAGNVFSSFIINTGSKKAFIVGTGTAGAGFSASNNVNNGLTAFVSCTFADVTAPALAVETQVITNGDAIDQVYGGTANVINSGNTLVNEDISFDPSGNAAGKLDSTLKTAEIDPRPAFAFGGVIGGAQAQGFGLEGVAYRGAFENVASTPLWTDGWTTLSIAGLLD